MWNAGSANKLRKPSSTNGCAERAPTSKTLPPGDLMAPQFGRAPVRPVFFIIDRPLKIPRITDTRQIRQTRRNLPRRKLPADSRSRPMLESPHPRTAAWNATSAVRRPVNEYEKTPRGHPRLAGRRADHDSAVARLFGFV